jgi:hypothetical protein
MNRKLTLSLDELSVESFHISASGGPEGTVRAHETGQWDLSCGASCGGTCAGSCDYSCNCPAMSNYCNPNTWNDFSCKFTCQTCDDYTRTRMDEEVSG